MQDREPVPDWMPRFANSLRHRYPMVSLILTRTPAGHLHLALIDVDPGLPDRGVPSSRGDGRGTAVMTELLAAADAHGETVVLTPTAEFGADYNRLLAWYTRLGFLTNDGARKDPSIEQAMYRTPRGHAVPMPAPSHVRDTRPLTIGNGHRPILVPGETGSAWPNASVRKLLGTLAGYGLPLRTDWCHGITRGSVRLIIGEPGTDTHGDVMIGLRTGAVLRGYLVAPGRTHGMAEFRAQGHWLTVLCTHEQLVRSHTTLSA